MGNSPTWTQHFDVVQGIMVIMLGLISWFAVQSFQGILSQINVHSEAIKEIQEKHTDLKSEVSELRGAHDAELNHHRRWNDDR